MKNKRALMFMVLLIPLLGYSKDPNWEIVTLNHQLYQDVVFNQLVGDTMVVQAYGKTFEIPVDSIQSIRDVNGPYGHPNLGFFIGGLGGGIVGNSLIPGPKPGLDHLFEEVFAPIIYTTTGIILGSLVGMTVGGSIKTDASYDFQKMDHTKKIETINQLMQPYAMKPVLGGS